MLKQPDTINYMASGLNLADYPLEFYTQYFESLNEHYGMETNINSLDTSPTYGKTEEMPSNIDDHRFKEANSIHDLSEIEQNFSKCADPKFIRFLCHSNVPGWDMYPIEKIRVEKIMSGLTNQLFHVYILKDLAIHFPIRNKRVLFRIYGEDTSHFYDSEFEVKVFKTLGRYRIAPKLIAEFNGGRIEEWIYGKPLLVEDLRNPCVLSTVANIIGGFHRLHKDIADFPFTKRDYCSYLFDKMLHWITSNLILDKAEEINVYNMISKDEIESLQEEAKCLKELILSHCKTRTPAKDIVFCHNDIQENNFLQVGSNLTLIDYEYTNYNYAGFDVANFFTEAMIDYTYPNYPYFFVDINNYPCTESRSIFASVYLSKVLNQNILPSDKIIKPFLDQVEWFSLVSHLYWGFWGLIRSPPKIENGTFDFILYARVRFTMYWTRKEELINNSKKFFSKEH